jgi:predicted  nucleic acid-binding Zn-ribbon protein
MKDGYPHQLADTSQRDYEDLLASFRQVTEERNALRSDVERLHETLVGVRDAQTPRSRLYGV